METYITESLDSGRTSTTRPSQGPSSYTLAAARHTQTAPEVPGIRKLLQAVCAKLQSAPILVQPDPSQQFIVEVDASDVGVGAVLSQRAKGDNKLHPCTFFSKKLSPTERNYDEGNRELLAVKLALEDWRHWLEGSEPPFTSCLVGSLTWEIWSTVRTALQGVSRTLLLMQRHFWLLSLAADTREYVGACIKTTHRPPAGLLPLLPVPGHLWSHIVLDCVAGLPTSASKNTILTIVDRKSVV